jgi:hypothetical protein
MMVHRFRVFMKVLKVISLFGSSELLKILLGSDRKEALYFGIMEEY